MKKGIIVFPIICVLLISCTSDKKVKPDSPENLSILASYAINVQDFELLKSYFTETRKQTLNSSYFNDLRDVESSGTEIKTFSYLRKNDQTILLEIIFDHESKTYKIQEIIKVPKEYTDLFNLSENR